MSRFFRCVVLSVSCFFTAGSAFAGLEWEATSKKIEVHPLQASEIISYAFKNTGTNAVTIVSLKPSCSCITGKLDKETYASGESGTVEMTFDLQGREGAQLKSLTVKTDEASINPTKLYVSTTIPTAYTISSQRVIWNEEEARAAKSIRLTNTHKTPFPIEKAVPAKDGITVEVKTIREGFEYDLIITPNADLKGVTIPIIIYPATPKELDAVRTYTIYATVK